jgi:hypothetical protein
VCRQVVAAPVIFGGWSPRERRPALGVSALLTAPRGTVSANKALEQTIGCLGHHQLRVVGGIVATPAFQGRIKLLFRQLEVRTSINRAAEAMTIFAVICAAMFRCTAHGPPWLAYWYSLLQNTFGSLW